MCSTSVEKLLTQKQQQRKYVKCKIVQFWKTPGNLAPILTSHGSPPTQLIGFCLHFWFCQKKQGKKHGSHVLLQRDFKEGDQRDSTELLSVAAAWQVRLVLVCIQHFQMTTWVDNRRKDAATLQLAANLKLCTEWLFLVKWWSLMPALLLTSHSF